MDDRMIYYTYTTGQDGPWFGDGWVAEKILSQEVASYQGNRTNIRNRVQCSDGQVRTLYSWHEAHPTRIDVPTPEAAPGPDEEG